MSYLLGQRVILHSEICTTVKSENPELPNTDKELWVFVPSQGYASRYDTDNIHPLPNGQV